MAKKAADSVLDALLDKIATANQQSVCEGEPADRAAAITDKPTGAKLAITAMSAPDYTKADAGGGGRELTVGAKANILIDVTGTGDHVALVDATELLFVTTATPQSLTATGGNTVSIGQWKVTIGDPT